MKYVILFIIGCYCVVSSYEHGRVAQHQQQGYDLADIEALNALAGTPVKPWKKPKVTLREQAEAYALVYDITDANINSYKEWW